MISEIRGSLPQTIKKKLNLNCCREIDALFCVWYILCVRETVHIFQKHAHTHNQVNLSWWSPHHHVINRNHVCQFEQHFAGCVERLRDRIPKRIADVSQDDVYLQNESLNKTVLLFLSIELNSQLQKRKNDALSSSIIQMPQIERF